MKIVCGTMRENAENQEDLEAETEQMRHNTHIHIHTIALTFRVTHNIQPYKMNLFEFVQINELIILMMFRLLLSMFRAARSFPLIFLCSFVCLHVLFSVFLCVYLCCCMCVSLPFIIVCSRPFGKRQAMKRMFFTSISYEKS